jgi:hypothetical protein
LRWRCVGVVDMQQFAAPKTYRKKIGVCLSSYV